MSVWLQFAYVNKRTFSSNISLLEFSFPFEFYILYSTIRKSRRSADGAERQLNEIKAGQSDAQTS